MGTLWSVLYFYCNWQISAKKKTTTREWEGMGVILPGVGGTGFSPSFFVVLGREEINFCGSGTGEVWEFTPVSPPNKQLFIELLLLLTLIFVKVTVFPFHGFSWIIDFFWHYEMATHSDSHFDLTDWSPGDDSLPQQGEALPSIGGLKAQVQVLQAEVAVLQWCLHDSIDLQQGILDRLVQQGVLYLLCRSQFP